MTESFHRPSAILCKTVLTSLVQSLPVQLELDVIVKQALICSCVRPGSSLHSPLVLRTSLISSIRLPMSSIIRIMRLIDSVTRRSSFAMAAGMLRTPFPGLLSRFLLSCSSYLAVDRLKHPRAPGTDMCPYRFVCFVVIAEEQVIMAILISSKWVI